jgi:hypothetical protein
MPKAAGISRSDALRSVPPAMKPTIEAARRVVRAAAKNASEIAYRSQPPHSTSSMWKLFRYAIDGGNVVGIGTFADHSTLFFYRGRELDDGSGLLQGRGKDARFISLRTAVDAERPEVKRLLRRAFDLASRKD